MRRSTGLALLVLALILGALGTARWLASPSSPAASAARSSGNNPAAARFAGSASCADCHDQEVAAWRRSHHAQSMAVASRETVLGDFKDVGFGSGAGAVRFLRRGDDYVVRAADRSGARREFRITHTFGVYPLQQYLVATERGRLQALDVAWDARPREQGGQRWFRLSEGEPGAGTGVMHWTAPAFNWNHQCADCHSTGLRKGYDAKTDTFQTTFAEVSVACEACHGSAAAHADWQRRRRGTLSRWFAGEDPGFVGIGGGPGTGAGGAERRAWLFDASRPLDFRPGVELQVCAQCHSRRTQISDAYQPHEGYVDHYVSERVAAPLYFVDGQIRDEVFEYGSFRQSRMFAKGVTCSDCHEPHSLQLRRESDSLCLGCHEAKYRTSSHHHHREDGAGVSCVDCHMTPRTYMGVDSRRDHSFRVPRPDLSVSLGVPNACNGCHADRPAQWAADSAREWFGPKRGGLQQFGPALDAIRREAPDAGQRIEALLTDPATPDVAKATALAQSGVLLTPERLDWLRRGLAHRDPDIRIAALEAAETLPMDWRWSVAATALEDPARSVRIRAVQLLGASDALGSEQERRLAPAVAEYLAAVAVNADRPVWRSQHAVWLAARGQREAARAELEAALRLDADFTPAAANLADLYRETGRDDLGEIVLVRALERDAASASLHHALGLLRVRQRRYPEALAALSRAVELAPDEASHRYAEAVALDSLGQRAKAVASLERHEAQGRTSRREATLLASLRGSQTDRAGPSVNSPRVRHGHPGK